jgi:hypothetical protein
MKSPVKPGASWATHGLRRLRYRPLAPSGPANPCGLGVCFGASHDGPWLSGEQSGYVPATLGSLRLVTAAVPRRRLVFPARLPSYGTFIHRSREARLLPRNQFRGPRREAFRWNDLRSPPP